MSCCFCRKIDSPIAEMSFDEIPVNKLQDDQKPSQEGYRYDLTGFDLKALPEVVISNIARFLSPEDVVRWSRTCHYFHERLPVLCYLGMIGEPFHIYGPYRGEGEELYFNGPKLETKVRRLVMYIKWIDQAWGNKKGRIYVSLMRDDKPVCANYKTFGICEHHMKEQSVELVNDPVVTKAEPGDYYQFTRVPGGGGGHELIVKKFKAIAELIL